MQASRTPAAPSAEDGAIGGGSESVGRVLAALAELSDADRELLTLLAWDGLTRAETAEALGCSRATLAVRVHRARRRLLAAMTRAAPAGGQGSAPHPETRPELGVVDNEAI
jgi:RNA polymerase sigma-70 factor (ECF subfamily)